MLETHFDSLYLESGKPMDQAVGDIRGCFYKWVVSLMVEPRFYTAMTAVQFCHDLPKLWKYSSYEQA